MRDLFPPWSVSLAYRYRAHHTREQISFWARLVRNEERLLPHVHATSSRVDAELC